MIGKETTAMTIAHPPNFGRRVINMSVTANPTTNGLNILFIYLVNVFVYLASQ